MSKNLKTYLAINFQRLPWKKGEKGGRGKRGEEKGRDSELSSWTITMAVDITL